MMGYICVPSFIILSICIAKLAHLFGLYHNVWPGANSCHFFFKTFLHTSPWIPVLMQSFIFESYLVFELRLLKLNNDNKKKKKKKKKNFENHKSGL